MNKSFILKALASVFSTVKVGKPKFTSPEKKYSLRVNVQRKISGNELQLLGDALKHEVIDPEVDGQHLAAQLKFELTNYCRDAKPKQQIHLSIPLVSCNAKLTKRKALYALKNNERFVVADRGFNSYWVLTKNI